MTKMRANYKTYSRQELNRIAIETAERYKDQMYDSVSKDCTYQALAVAFWTLHKKFGFGKQRLAKLKTEIEVMYYLEEGEIRNVQKILKDDFNIDFNESDIDKEERDDV